MTDEEINMAIAVACGWIPKHYSFKCDGITIFRCGACGSTAHSNCFGDGTGAVHFSCKESPCCDEAVPPNCCSDLNAMHEAEKILTEIQFCEYIEYLGGVLAIHSSARWRAEAFLRTLCKWKEVAE